MFLRIVKREKSTRTHSDTQDERREKDGGRYKDECAREGAEREREKVTDEAQWNKVHVANTMDDNKKRVNKSFSLSSLV